MKIRSAFPDILARQFPVVRPEYPLLTVLYLLRMNSADAVPIMSQNDVGPRAVFGFSCLPQLMTLGPSGFRNLVKGPCERASDQLACLSVDRNLEALLKSFKERKLGFAFVQDPENRERGSLAGLGDFIQLYESQVVRTNLVVDDVGTPIFSMPPETSIRNALEAMFRLRHRRVFITGEGKFVSDRSIMQRLFSPDFLDEIANDQRGDILAGPISGLHLTRPKTTLPQTPVKDAARKLRDNPGACLVLDGKMVVTPWDLVMKPWLSHKLKIG